MIEHSRHLGLVALLASTLVAVPEVLAEEDDVVLSCRYVAIRLCVGDTTLESCPTPWLEGAEALPDDAKIYVSRISDTWELTKSATTIVLEQITGNDDRYYEFTFTDEEDWGRLRIDRVSGEAFELHGLPNREILAARAQCERVERLF